MKKITEKLFLEMLQKVEAGEMKHKDIAEHFGCSSSLVTKWKQKLQAILNVPESWKDLTDKEQKFVLARAEGKNQTQAALSSFECGSLGSAKALGNRLAKRDDIQLAISDIMEEEGIGRRRRIQVLKDHIENTLDRQASLKGIDIANKMEGVYVEKTLNVNVDYAAIPTKLRDLEEMERQLRKELGRISGEEQSEAGFYLEEGDILDADFFDDR